MSADFRSRTAHRKLTSRRGSRLRSRRVVTVGDLVSAVFDVTGSAEESAKLLAPTSPLAKALGRKIVVG